MNNKKRRKSETLLIERSEEIFDFIDEPGVGLDDLDNEHLLVLNAVSMLKSMKQLDVLAGTERKRIEDTAKEEERAIIIEYIHEKAATYLQWAKNNSMTEIETKLWTDFVDELHGLGDRIKLGCHERGDQGE